MKNLVVFLIVFSLGLVAGGFAIAVLWSGEALDGGGMSVSAEKTPLYWVAPMDKNYRRDGPGKSPMGMDLVPVYEEQNGGDADNSIKISPVVENNLGVKVSKVVKEALVMPVETIGTVQFDESRMTHIHSRVEGWIERLGVSASGDRVVKGQTLYELYSPALVSAQEEYLAAVRSGNKNLIKASSSRLYALGITRAQVSALKQRKKVEHTISVAAESDGIVIDLKVRKGMYIQPATEVLSFGTLDSVWIIGEVFERQAYLVDQGQSVEIEFPSMPGRTWKGMVNYVYPQLDPHTRTLSIRVRVVNEGHALKPNMLANLRVISRSQDEGLSVPRQAVIKAGRNSRVVKSLGEGRYQSVLVNAGYEGENKSGEARIQILEGLSEADLVVTSALFLIDSESHVDQELMRMTEPAAIEEPSKPSNFVVTTGKVNKVMTAMGMVSITHDPIPEWDWPTMKMDFPVSEEVSLSEFSEGEVVTFQLEKTGGWDYLITAVGEGLLQGQDADMHSDMQVQMDMDMNMDMEN